MRTSAAAHAVFSVKACLCSLHVMMACPRAELLFVRALICLRHMNCTATGANSELIYVSLKSGGAVSRARFDGVTTIWNVWEIRRSKVDPTRASAPNMRRGRAPKVAAELYLSLIRIYQPTGGAARLSMVIDGLRPNDRADDA
jgi:hypothetical protein